MKATHYTILTSVVLPVAFTACNPANREKELELRERELNLKEKTLELRAKEDSVNWSSSAPAQAQEPDTSANVSVPDAFAVYKLTRTELQQRFPESFRTLYTANGVQSSRVNLNSATIYEMLEDMTQQVITTDTSEVEWVTRGLAKRDVFCSILKRDNTTWVISWKCGRAIIFADK